MKIDCIGAGPGGLYFAILAKLRDPAGRVRVFERRPADHSAGWGIVLDKELRGQLQRADPESAAAINRQLFRWDTIDVLAQGRRIASRGHPFGAIGRRCLLDILSERALALGVEVHHNSEVSAAQLPDADLVVAGDGAGSATRECFKSAFMPRVTYGRNHYLWCGSPRLFANFTFALHGSERGWIWAQAYQFDDRHSTFIAECDPFAYESHRLGVRPRDEAIAYLESVYAPALEGAPLLVPPGEGGRLEWLRFRHVECARWHYGKVVLLGDAAHTSHYSLGSGTKLALEDGIALTHQVFDVNGSLAARLDNYQSIRRTRVSAVQALANNSNRWFERLPEFSHLNAEQFACALLTRTRYLGQAVNANHYDKLLRLARSGVARAGADRRLRKLLLPLDFGAATNLPKPC